MASHDATLGRNHIVWAQRLSKRMSSKGKGTGLYAFMNFRLFDVEPQAKEIFKDLDYAEAYYTKDIKFVVRIVMNDKESNSLVPFVKFLYNMAPKAQASIPYESYDMDSEMEDDDFFADEEDADTFSPPGRADRAEM